MAQLKARMPGQLVEYLLSQYPDLPILEPKPKKVQFCPAEEGDQADASADASDTNVPMRLPERMLEPRNKYPVNEIRTFRGALQLILEMDATLENGKVKPIRILVDTGAEANLIRTGYIPDHLTYSARRLLRLVGANGLPIRGERTAELKIGFKHRGEIRFFPSSISSMLSTSNHCIRTAGTLHAHTRPWVFFSGA